MIINKNDNNKTAMLIDSEQKLQTIAESEPTQPHFAYIIHVPS